MRQNLGFNEAFIQASRLQGGLGLLYDITSVVASSEKGTVSCRDPREAEAGRALKAYVTAILLHQFMCIPRVPRDHIIVIIEASTAIYCEVTL